MADPQIDEAELAARYGFAMAVLNGNPELKALFDRAVAQTYTPERFQAELRGTDWFRRSSEARRNSEILRAADPSTWQAQFDQVKTRTRMLAAEIGAVLPESAVDAYTNHFYTLGYDDNQAREHLSRLVQYVDGRMIGQAGQWETELRAWSRDMGLNYGDEWYRAQVQTVVAGRQTLSDVQKAIAKQAASAFPHLADRLAAGETVATIAEPYRQTMAKLLEMNPEAVTLADPTIKKALQAKDQDGKPVLRTLYDFENDLRQDARWLKTTNAQDAAMDTTARVLKDMGVIS